MAIRNFWKKEIFFFEWICFSKKKKKIRVAVQASERAASEATRKAIWARSLRSYARFNNLDFQKEYYWPARFAHRPSRFEKTCSSRLASFQNSIFFFFCFFVPAIFFFFRKNPDCHLDFSVNGNMPGGSKKKSSL